MLTRPTATWRNLRETFRRTTDRGNHPNNPTEVETTANKSDSESHTLHNTVEPEIESSSTDGASARTMMDRSSDSKSNHSGAPATTTNNSRIDQTSGDSTWQSSDHAHLPKPVSDKKLAANRRNAQESTGPKSRAGKRRSSMNATKSGTFMSKTMIFDGGLGQEQADELSELIEALREDWQPNSTEEELLVEERGMYRWRWHRRNPNWNFPSARF